MKNQLFILVFFQLFSGSIFCQYHFLESYNDVIIGPQNVDVIFPEQIGFYVEEYYSMINELENLQSVHQERLNRIQNRKKISYRERNQIKQEKETLAILEIEKEIIEEYLFFWAELKNEEKEIQFGKEYNDSTCFRFYTIDGVFSDKDCKVELDRRTLLKWKEFMPLNDFQEKQMKQMYRPASTKWIKKRADRNCLSDDPKDCMVWCLVEIPAEYEIEKYYDGVPDDFQNSDEEGILYRELEIENSKKKKYRVFYLPENKELRIIDFNEIPCN